MGGMTGTALGGISVNGDVSKPMVSLGADAKSQNSGRRAFIAKMSFALIGVATALVAIPPVGFLLGPLLRKVTQQWRTVGEVSKFVIGETVRIVFFDPSPMPRTGDTAQTAAWLRRIPFRADHANPGWSWVEGDATDVGGSGEWGSKGSRRAVF
jgi:hypothetical protein